MSQTERRPLTWRQLRLLDWLQDPHSDDLPINPAIRWQDALWKVSDLARRSGVTQHYTYAMCRRDLEALQSRNLVAQLVPGRWRVGGLP